MKIKARSYSSVIKELRPEAFYLPAPLVAPQHSPILRLRFDPVRFVRRAHLNSSLGKLFIKNIRVVIAVANQALRLLTGDTLLKSLSDKGDFMRRSSRRVNGERKTMKVCQTHSRSAFAPFCGPTARPLF